ncbi:MAG: hypothetical protein CSB01_03155, partial [Bacteroidia bacterium]
MFRSLRQLSTEHKNKNLPMLHQKYSWTSFDNGYLFAQSFTPANEVKAVISFVHGIGEHSSRYHAWFETFANRGIAVVAFDYRAHGK